MDVLSEVLKVVHLDGAMFFNAEFSAPWAVASPKSELLKHHLAPSAGHLIVYHLMTEGHAYVRIDGADQVLLAPGDIVVFPHGDAHTMGNGHPRQALDGLKVVPEILIQGMKPLRVGGGGETTRFVCGYMTCDAEVCRQLLECLPSILKVNIRHDASGQWLENSIRFSVEEAGASRAGSTAVLAKLSEVLFVDTLRRYVNQLPPEGTGWLNGTRDPVVGRSLSLLHTRPAESWTMEKLARQAGVSRSVLAERFAQYLGEPPMAYLTRWRMQLGAQCLRSTNHSVLATATEVGYQSEAAFNRAFRRQFGIPPARYRSRTRAQETEPIAA